MLKTIPNIVFIEGVPGDLETLINPSIRNLVVIDDLMHELSNDQRMTNLFTEGCHHRNLSVIFILQNIFHRGKELRDMSLNSHYLVVFKSPRDSSQVNHLARQMFPGHVKKRLRMQQKGPMDIYFVILNRKHLPTSGCVRIFSPGRLSTLTSKKYKKRESHKISSVEDGTAT